MAKSDVETAPETDLKQNDETSQDTEDSLTTSKVNQAISLRLNERLSYRDIAKKTGLSLASVSRMLKGIDLKEDPSDGDMDSSIPSLPIQSMPPSQNMQQGSDPTASIDKFARYTSMKSKDAIAELLKDNQRLENHIKSLQGPMQHNVNHDGHNESMSQRELIGYLQTQELIETIKESIGKRSRDDDRSIAVRTKP